MKQYVVRSLFIFITFALPISAAKVGLCIVATGKYIQFVQPLIDSAQQYFCKGHEVTYFVFTDGQAPQMPQVVSIYQQKLGWPYDTMMRPRMYWLAKNLLENMDYLFTCDADMRFCAPVGNEILHERVATLHPGFVHKRGSYETNPVSKAFVSWEDGEYYFAGGFWGGNKHEFLRMVETVTRNIDEDTTKGYTAVWHDESHINRYFIDNPPTYILTPSYCYPESWKLPYPKKLLALDKNHNAMRA